MAHRGTQSLSEHQPHKEKEPFSPKNDGPNWIIAAATLITALVAVASFYAGRATTTHARQPIHPQPSKHSSKLRPKLSPAGTNPPSTAPTAPRPEPSKTAKSSKSPTYVYWPNVRLVSDNSIQVTTTYSRPPLRPGKGDLEFIADDPRHFTTASGNGLAAIPVPASYRRCKAANPQSSTVNLVPTKAVCFQGHGVIAAITFIKYGKTAEGGRPFVILDITVWKDLNSGIR